MKIKTQKILFLLAFLIVLILPLASHAAGTVPPKLESAMNNIKVSVVAIGTAMVIIGFVIAGILYLSVGGSPEKMGKAKTALIAAVIGAALVALATGAEVIVTIVKNIVE